MVVWVIPKGGVNLKEALDFIVFASDPKRMADHANYISYAPVRKSAVTYIDDRVRKYLLTTNKNVGNILRIDHKWWITNKQAIAIKARFAQWRIEKPWRPNFHPPSEGYSN
jgi:putative spermidine/putrescine transport system substrate-binding protein